MRPSSYWLIGPFGFLFGSAWWACGSDPIDPAQGVSAVDATTPVDGDGTTDGDAGKPQAPLADASADAPASDASSASVKQLIAGYEHSCALLTNGAVRCWGHGSFGDLGYGVMTNIGDNETPDSVGDVPVGASVTALAAAGHTCAIITGGKVRCWGYSGVGQLGYGNTDTIGDDETPAFAGDVNLGATAVQVAVGGSHTCALLSTGAVRCWGYNQHGQLGYGVSALAIGDDELPASAGDVPVGATVTQIATGADHTCVLLSGGTVRCWGSNFFGQLGYSNTRDVGINETPASKGDVQVGGTVTQLAAGADHTCALLSSGAVRCWGRGDYGTLGYGNKLWIGDDELPTSAGDVPVGGTITQIAAEGGHTCALLSTGTVRCWGSGAKGQLGHANQKDIGDDETPASVGDVPLGSSAVQIAVGASHTCALLSSGAVRCWGWGEYGQLGYGNVKDIGDDETPASVGNVKVW